MITIYDPSNNVKNFLSDLQKVLNIHPELKMEHLGMIHDLPILLLTPKKIMPEKKSFLVAAGFHGNEIAGPLGLIEYLKSEKPETNVSYLPLVNPVGFGFNSRFNAEGMSPNSNFIHEDTTSAGLSEEGKLLMTNMHHLVTLAKDGFLTLHEDDTNNKFYMYTFGSNDKIRQMLECGQQMFGIIEKGFYKDIPITHGLIPDEHDGTFEDYMAHQSIPLVICTETPQKDDLVKRVTTNKNLIKLFVQGE